MVKMIERARLIAPYFRNHDDARIVLYLPGLFLQGLFSEMYGERSMFHVKHRCQVAIIYAQPFFLSEYHIKVSKSSQDGKKDHNGFTKHDLSVK